MSCLLLSGSTVNPRNDMSYTGNWTTFQLVGFGQMASVAAAGLSRNKAS